MIILLPMSPGSSSSRSRIRQGGKPRRDVLGQCRMFHDFLPHITPYDAVNSPSTHAMLPEHPETSVTLFVFIFQCKLPQSSNFPHYSPSVASSRNAMSPKTPSETAFPGNGEVSTLSRFTHIPTGSTVADPASVEEADGRTYNGYRQGQYHLPNDAEEQDRLDLQHHLWGLLLDGKLGLAPVQHHKAIDVLDIGTGTGIWVIQFAERYPTAKVIGVDISLIQPDSVPSNCTFFREDSEEDPWVFDRQFDYIHIRAMCMCLQDPKGMVRRIYDHLHPGGWFEYQDMMLEVLGADQDSNEAQDRNPTSLRKCLQAIPQGLMTLVGRDALIIRKYKAWMLELGFVDVVDRPMLAPLNAWPLDPKEKELGKWMAEDMIDGTKTARKLIIASGVPESETDRYLERVHRDIRDTSQHNYIEWHAIYGRKPFADEAESK
jgi:SAM-dependent methyltransferase